MFEPLDKIRNFTDISFQEGFCSSSEDDDENRDEKERKKREKVAMIIQQIKCHNTRMVRSRTVVVVKPGKARKRQLEAIEKRKLWRKFDIECEETSKEETIKWECEDSDNFLRMYGGGGDECERESSDEEIEKQGEELELKAFIFEGEFGSIRIPGSDHTSDGVLCPFCKRFQKRLISHVKKVHNKEMEEVTKAEDFRRFETEIKKHMESNRQRRYKHGQLNSNPEEYAESKRDNQHQYLKKRKEEDIEKLKKDQRKWTRNKRSNTSDWLEEAIKQFNNETMYGPIFPCVCCHTLNFRDQVVELTPKVMRNIRKKAKEAALKKGLNFDQVNLKETEEQINLIQKCWITKLLQVRPMTVEKRVNDDPDSDIDEEDMWMDAEIGCDCGCGGERVFPAKWFFPWQEEWLNHFDNVLSQRNKLAKSNVVQSEPRMVAFLKEKDEHMDFLMDKVMETDRHLRNGILVHKEDEIYFQRKATQQQGALTWIESRLQMANKVKETLWNYGWLMSEDQKDQVFQQGGLNMEVFPYCKCKFQCVCGTHHPECSSSS